MRTYLIDEIVSSELEKINVFLKENAISSNLDHLFWVRMPDDLLSETQFEHKNCRPHVFAVELGQDWIKLELFVRTLKSIRCDCPAYSTPIQRDYIFKFGDGIIEQLKIRT